MTTTLPDFVNLGPSQVVYATDRCLQTVTVRSLTNGQSLSLGQFPDCATGAAVSDSSVFIASGTKIYSWDLFRGFFEIARGTSGLRGELLLDTQNVYFADSTGIKRVSRSGGTVFNLDPGSDVRLLALDGTLLYYRFGSQLRRIPVGGGTAFIVNTNVTGVIDLTFDSSSLYWAIGPATLGGSSRIERMAKGGGTTTRLHTTTVAISDLVAASGNLYWVETRPDDISSILRRTSAGAVTVPKPDLFLAAGMRAMGGFLYWNETVFGSGPLQQKVNRATLP